MSHTRTLALFTLSACLSAACGSAPARQPAAAEAVPVTVAAPTVVQETEAITVSGSVVSPDNPVALAFAVGGRVTRVGPRVGDAVKRGAVLAAIDTTEYALGVDAAVAQVSAARIAADRADDELRRAQQLLETKSIAPNDFEKIRAAAAAARDSLAQVVASEGLARKRLSDTTLHAPLDGYVTARNVEPGNMVAPGVPAFQVVQLDPIEVNVGIPETDVHLVSVGGLADVTVPALPSESFAGTVRLLNVAADPGTRTYMARIQIRNPQQRLRVGMVATAAITGTRLVDVLTVPPQAVVRDPQGASSVFVYFPEQRQVYSRRIEVGAPRGVQIEVRSGLTAADQIVVAGQERLRDGMAVTASSTSPEVAR